MLRLHENLENEVMVFCLMGQVIDINELWVEYKRSGGTREAALSAVSVVAYQPITFQDSPHWRSIF